MDHHTTTTVQRKMIESSGRLGRRSEEWWQEEITLGSSVIQVRYADTGSKSPHTPWMAFELHGELDGSPLSLAGDYLAWPQNGLRKPTQLADGSTAIPTGRRSIQVERPGLALEIATHGLLGAAVLRDGEPVSTFGPAYGPFEADLHDDGGPLATCLLSIVASGLYRLVQRGRLLDSALLNIGSPFHSSSSS